MGHGRDGSGSEQVGHGDRVGRADLVGSWPTWTAFRAADVRRIGPCEVEFGSQWQGAKADLPWRVVWLEGTGEVVAIQWAVGGQGGAAGPVELLGRAGEREAVDAALKDWWHMCGHVGSLDWVRSRLRKARIGVGS